MFFEDCIFNISHRCSKKRYRAKIDLKYLSSRKNTHFNTDVEFEKTQYATKLPESKNLTINMSCLPPHSQVSHQHIFLLLYSSPYVNPSFFKCIFCTKSNILILLIPFYVTSNTEKQNPSKEMNLALGLHQPMTVEADLVATRKCSIISTSHYRSLATWTQMLKQVLLPPN